MNCIFSTFPDSVGFVSFVFSLFPPQIPNTSLLYCSLHMFPQFRLPPPPSRPRLATFALTAVPSSHHTSPNITTPHTAFSWLMPTPSEQGTLQETTFTQTYYGDYNPATAAPQLAAVGGFKDGFSTALQYMVAGDDWMVYIPQELFYGSLVRCHPCLQRCPLPYSTRSDISLRNRCAGLEVTFF